MKIDVKMIAHLEKLARIELTADEREQLTGQLDRIVSYVEKLQKVDTGDVAPTSAVVHQQGGRLRPDEPVASLSHGWSHVGTTIPRPTSTMRGAVARRHQRIPGAFRSAARGRNASNPPPTIPDR